MKIAEHVHDTERTVTESCTYTLGAVVRGPDDQGQREAWEAVPTEARVALAHQLLATLTDEERDLVAPYATSERKEALVLAQKLLDERSVVASSAAARRIEELRKRAEKAEESAIDFAQQVTELRDKASAAEAELEKWKDASGLECGGDHDGVTPAAMRKYWEGVEAELANAHKDADMLTSRLAVASGIGGDDVSIGAIVSLVRENRLVLQPARHEAMVAGWMPDTEPLDVWIAMVGDRLRANAHEADVTKERLAILHSVRRVARDAGWRPPEPLDVWVARLDNALASERLAVETERLAVETERALSDALKASHNGVHTALLEVIEAAQAEGWEPEDEDLPEWIHRRCDASRAQAEADSYADRLESRLNEVTGSLRAVSAAASANGWDGAEGLEGWIRCRCCDEKSEAKRLLEKLVEATKRIAEDGT